MHRTRFLAAFAAALLIAGAWALSACGDDGSSSGGDSASSTAASTQASGQANGTDLAFASEMIGHHQMAVQMAEMAEKNASQQQTKSLAQAIITAQTAEIAQLKKAKARMRAAGVTTSDLGMNQSEMGMDMDMDALGNSDAFDREFIDMMIPHHQGAIRMARVQLANGQDAEMRALAKDVVSAQSKEIEEMNMWRKDWYGAESPAGGVPAADESADHMSTQEHMSTQDMGDSMDHSN